MADPAPLAARFQNFATRLLRQARVTGDGSSLTSAQFSALSTLHAHAPLLLTELAALENVTHPTMSRLVAGLVKADYVARLPDKIDRRAVRLSLTDKGTAAYRDVYARRLAAIEALLSRLKPETVADLLQALESFEKKTDTTKAD